MKIIIALTLILTLTLTAAEAYIRDPFLSSSEDNVGIGYANGIMFFGEKILEDKRSSFGSFFMPSLNYTYENYLTAFWEMSYNRQLSESGSDNSVTAVLGVVGYQEKTPDISSDNEDYKIMPEIGLVMGFRNSENLQTRLRLVLGPLFGIEWGYRFLEQTEVSIGIGLPLFSVRFVHNLGEPIAKRTDERTVSAPPEESSE